MKEIPCRCYKIAHKLPLEKICSFLSIEKPMKWRDVVFLNNEQIQGILKENGEGTRIYLFRSGCVAFIGFTESQARTLLEFLRSFLESKFDAIFYEYHEEHTLWLDENQQCKLHAKSEKWIAFDEEITKMTALVLAKSLETQWFESAISSLLDETEYYIRKLQQGKVNLHRRQFKKTILKLIRFEFESVSSIKFFDWEIVQYNGLRINPILQELSVFYELFERVKTIEEKLLDLKKFMKTYREQAMRREQRRIYIYELIFLALFPLTGLFKKVF